MNLGLSGALARRFIASKITPLILIAATLAGLAAFATIPREDDPQIHVPMVDVIVNADGLRAADAVELLTKPLETILRATPGVEHVTSITDDNHLTVTARFVVGTNEDAAVLRVNDKIRANLNRIPLGIPEPLVVGHGLDDVPILTLTLTPNPASASRWTEANLSGLAEKLQTALMQVPDLGLTSVVGDDPEEIRVEPDPEKLMLYGVTLQQLVARLKAANETFNAGTIRDDGLMETVAAGQTLSGIPDIGLLLVTTRDNRPVYVSDVTRIVFGPAPAGYRVWSFTRGAGQWVQSPAVTLAIAKRAGANEITLTRAVLAQVKLLQGSLIPPDIDVQVTRNYGQTASEKANQLLLHLSLATISIIALLGFGVGWREAGVTGVVIPVTVMLTVFAVELMGYTLNRETFFGLIFAVGILADDAIVFIENISRHWGLNDGRSRIEAAVDAVAEVGNPTIIATACVITALIPLLFIPGIMGPFMSAVPATAASAMALSFIVAVVIVPWLMVKFTGSRVIQPAHAGSWLGRIYLWLARPLLAGRARAIGFLWVVGAATVLVAVSVFYFEQVKVKLLMVDNRPELDLVLDLAPGASLEDTERALFAAARIAGALPDVASMQAYAGTASPVSFQGLVRQYYQRQSPELGDLHIVLRTGGAHPRTSHAVALALRARLAAGFGLPPGASFKLVEAPAGPPLLATLVAEIYDADPAIRRAEAAHVRDIFSATPGVVDIDESYRPPPPELSITADQDELAYFGVQQSDVNDTLAALFGGVGIGYSYRGAERAPLEIAVGLPESALSWNAQLAATPVPANALPGGRGIVELGQLVNVSQSQGSSAILRRDGHDLELVTGEMAGGAEAPLYAMFAIDNAINQGNWGSLPKPQIRFASQPLDESRPALLWQGEWELFLSTFQAMGFAFGAALLGIYILVVALFGSYRVPLLILTPIPLTLIGILLGHWVLHADFTAASFLGLTALAGIIVRNSILLVDFINRLRRPERRLRDVLLEAGAVRVKPIALTAISAMIGAVPILSDPVFPGLAISLIFGLISSTLLTLFVIPAIYIVLRDDGLPASRRR